MKAKEMMESDKVLHFLSVKWKSLKWRILGLKMATSNFRFVNCMRSLSFIHLDRHFLSRYYVLPMVLGAGERDTNQARRALSSEFPSTANAGPQSTGTVKMATSEALGAPSTCNMECSLGD